MTRPLFAVLVGLLVAPGCDSALDTEPFGIETIENQLATPEGAVVFVNSFYQPLPGLYGGGAMAVILESGTDDGWPFAQQFGGYKSREIDASTGQLGNIYENSFDGISRVNLYLAREGDIDFAGREDIGDQLRGEALFLRALYYFNLVRIFGDVALYTEPALTPTEGQRPRTPTAQVYDQIKADLTQAAALLPESYQDNQNVLANERGRATSGAALTALAKVHLTLEEWQSVVDVTGQITGYSLRPTYIDNFYGLILNTAGENRGESIFEAQFSAQGPGPKSSIRVIYTPRQTRDGQNQILPTDQAYPPAEPGAYGPNAFVQTFEEGDARFDVTLNKFGASRNPVTSLVNEREWFVQKWYSDVSNQETAFNIPVFRYAEVLLMRAEALNELGQTDAALDLLDPIRERAGLDDLDENDQGSAREAIRHERRVELGFEHKRLFDLNRWGILAEALRPQGVTINPAKITPHPITGKPQVLYPIPNIELQRNPNATQNAGY